MIRLARLDLERWGHFEGRSLTFGPAGSLHMVYGANEAGKSTTRRAVSALLFGVPERTGDTFGRPGADLRVGALLEVDGLDLEVVRRKGRKDTLLDAAGEPLDPAPLEGALGGLTREVHAGLFEITHESLVAGGLELLAGRGAVGESLFAAAVGTARLHGLMKRLEGEADTLFSTRPSKKELNVLLARHTEALRVLRDASLRPPRWEALSRELEDLKSAYAAAGSALEATEHERARLERLRGALPLAAHRATALRSLEALGDAPVLSADAAARRVAATERRGAAHARSTAAARDLARRGERLAELTVDEALLPLADAVDALHATPRDTARREELASQLVALEPRLEALLVSLTPSLADAGAVLDLDDDTRSRLESCLAQRAGFEQAARTADEAVADARRAAARAAAERSGAVADDAPLAAALRAARAAGPVDEHLARARAEEAAARAEAARCAERLMPRCGDADAVAALPVPDRATIEARLTAVVDAQRIAGELDLEAAAIADRTAVVQRDRARVGTDAPLLTASALDDARGARDERWRTIRAALTEPLAQDAARTLAVAFEDATTSADSVADTQLQRASDVAHLAALDRELTNLTRDAEELEHRRTRHTTTLTAALDAWSAAWAATARQAAPGSSPTAASHAAPSPSPAADRPSPEILDGGSSPAAAGHAPHPSPAAAADRAPLPAATAFPSPAEAGAWLGGRDVVLSHLATAADAARAAGAAKALRDQHAAALRAAIGDGAEDAPLVMLIELAEVRLDALREQAEIAARAAEAAARTATELEDAETVAERATEQVAAWREQWASLRDRCGLAEALAPDDALAAVRGLEQAARDRRERDSLRAAIEAIDARDAAYAARVAEVVATVAPDLAEQPAADAVAILHRRVTAARGAAAERDALVAAVAELEAERAEADAIVAEADEELAALRRAAGAEDDADLARREQASARAEELRQEIARLDGDLARAGGAPADDVAAAVADLDADALPARVEELEQLAATQRDARDAAGEALTRARDELARLERSDEAARARQEATSLEAQIQDVAERYARARLAQRVLRDAIARFRSAHEGPLLARANALFPALTRERYARLETDLDERDRDVLIAVTADGSRRRVEELSDGTREQLFLALRLAAIERHAATAQAVPVLFDDVLLESDDDRAEAILLALADLATHTQVIVLTHHRHLVEIATAALPAARLDVIELAVSDAPAPATPAAKRRRAKPGAKTPAAPTPAPTLARELEGAVAGVVVTDFGEQTSLL